MNRDRSYYRKQRKRAIHRKEGISVESAVKRISLRGRMGRRVVLQRGISTAPAGCAAESLMTIRNSGINGWRWSPLSDCARLSEPYDKNASHPRQAKYRRLWVGSVFDHIHYHRGVRSTLKQWI